MKAPLLRSYVSAVLAVIGVVLATCGFPIAGIIALLVAAALLIFDIIGLDKEIREADRRHKAFEAKIEQLLASREEDERHG